MATERPDGDAVEQKTPDTCSNIKSGLHCTIHRENNGEFLLSLWDTEEQAHNNGLYHKIELTEEQQSALQNTLSQYFEEALADTHDELTADEAAEAVTREVGDD